MKKGKEITLKTNYQYNVKSGTVDNKNPKSLYLQISAWGKPKNEWIEEYDTIIRKKSKRVKKKLFEVLDGNDFYKDLSIIDFNMASSGIDYNKRSFMSVEITLFKKQPLFSINSNEMIPVMTELSENLIKDVFESDEDFEFFKTKN
jgi:hypothetical protein